MKLRDDDDVYRARLLYLGPPGYTFPVHLPYAQWGMGALIFAVLSLVIVGLTGDWLFLGLTFGASLVLTSYLWRFVNTDRRARTVIRTTVMDTKTIKPTSEEKLPALVANITIHELPKG